MGREAGVDGTDQGNAGKKVKTECFCLYVGVSVSEIPWGAYNVTFSTKITQCTFTTPYLLEPTQQRWLPL